EENAKIIDGNNRSIEERNKQITGLEADVKAKKDEYDSFQKEYNSKNSEIAGIRDENNKFQKEKTGVRNDIFTARSSIAALNNEIHENEKLTVKLENDISSKQTFIRELKETTDDDRINEVEQKFNKSESSFVVSERSLNELKETLDSNQKRIQEINSGMRMNTNDIQSLKKQKENYFQMKDKVAGSKPVSGRKLQDILNSEKGHFDLIESFYFDEIGSYLAENDEDLKNPEFDKILLNIENNIKIVEGAEREEGFVDHIKNLFTLKKPALMKILKDGIVVTDIDNGIKIYKKFGVPVVAESGEIITSDGVLIRKRGSGVLNIMEEIRNIISKIEIAEKNIDELSKELESENGKGQGLEERFDLESVKTKELERETIRIRSDLDNLINAKERNLKRILMLESELERHKADLDRFSIQLTEKKKEKSQLEKDNTSLIRKRESLEKQEEEFSKNISSMEKEFFGLENKLNLSKERFTSGEAELNRLRRELRSLRDDIERKEEESNNLKGEIKEITGNIENFKNDRSSNIDIKDKSEESIKGNEQILNDLSTRIREENELLTKKRIELDEIKE
ncbi:MAG: hypothetical protein KAS97_03890, partial [Candidatus Aminicenantes bacterium]|nr:hypothetical protein [Candidatus Aminicenantes bacterium]